MEIKGFRNLRSERCVYTNDSGSIVFSLHVDDGYVLSKNDAEVTDLFDFLESKFEMKRVANPTSFLGLQIQKSEKGVTIYQKDFTQRILQKFGMNESKPVSVPMNDVSYDGSKVLETTYPYREAVGSLLYLGNRSRPDISFAVGFASRNMENPTGLDVTRIKRIFRYLKKTEEGLGIMYVRKECVPELIAYCDSDYAGDIQTRKSTTGFIIFFQEGPISWCSRKQPVVALSSCEAEFIAMAECMKELKYLQSVINEILKVDVKLKLYVDNMGTIDLMKNGVFNKRSRHIDVRFHFVHEEYKNGQIEVKYVPSTENIADILTKPLPKSAFEYLRKKILNQ